jgi:hypothetical protein
MRSKVFKTIVICYFGLQFFAARAADIKTGDILIDTSLEIGPRLYLFKGGENYLPNLLCDGGWELVYDIDRSRERVYFRDGSYNYYYVDLAKKSPRPKKVEFLPEDMKIAAVAADGSCLILYKPVWDDIFIEENPIYAKPRGGTAVHANMLFRYDMRTEKTVRLTYSYAHDEDGAWVTPDGECLAYRRQVLIKDLGAPARFQTTIIFSRIDGSLKYDLSSYFADAGINPEDIDFGFVFAPKAAGLVNDVPVYYAVFRLGDTVGVKITGPAEFEYYLAEFGFKGEDFFCDIEKRCLMAPAGLNLLGLSSELSTDKELYLYGYYNDGPGGVFLYDLERGAFDLIPHTGESHSVLVY